MDITSPLSITRNVNHILLRALVFYPTTTGRKPKKVSKLLTLQEELKEATWKLESNQVELEGMVSQLQEQQSEKEQFLLEQLKQKEAASKE
ncbi:hypothetical protein AB9M62_01650 [Bacillales bacterium AN1005]